MAQITGLQPPMYYYMCLRHVLLNEQRFKPRMNSEDLFFRTIGFPIVGWVGVGSSLFVDYMEMLLQQ